MIDDELRRLIETFCVDVTRHFDARMKDVHDHIRALEIVVDQFGDKLDRAADEIEADWRQGLAETLRLLASPYDPST